MINKKQMIKKEKAVEKWVKIGVVGVDSGTLMISDPCYLIDSWGEKEYDKLICKGFKRKNSIQIVNKKQIPLMVAFNSGFGDGCYEVWALIHDYGEWGKRIKEVKIILIDE